MKTTRIMNRRARAAALIACGSVLAATVSPAAAQGTPAGHRELIVAPRFESWTFRRGIYQPSLDGADSVQVDRVSQWSIPVAVVVPVGEMWTVDLSAAYGSGSVTLARPDAELKTDHYTLAGLRDVRLRAVGRVMGDNLVVTLGVNAPSGHTGLSREELDAARVLAAPALGFQAPALGSGLGGTAGVVLAREIASWAWALGASYELRRTYAPATIAAGLPAPDFTPGNVVHLSLGADGFLGEHRMTAAVSADYYAENRLVTTLPVTAGATSGAATASQPSLTRLGPVVTGEWQLRIATARLRELTLYAVDHYRTRFQRAGSTVPGSSGNYLAAGVQSVIPTAPSTGVVLGLDLRHETGLDVERSVATAGVVSGVLTVGLVRDFASGYSLEPFVRGQFGRFTSGARTTNATAVSGGVAYTLRF